MKKSIMIVMALVVCVGMAQAAAPDLGLGEGVEYRIAIVTQGTYTSAEGDAIGVYNALMQDEASFGTIDVDDNGAAVTWTVLGSTAAVDARDNTGTSPYDGGAYADAGIYRLDGAVVATGNADLWDGAVLVPINLTATGGAPVHLWARTGSTRIGTASPDPGPIKGGAYYGPLGGTGNLQQGSGGDPTNQWICPVEGGWIGDPGTVALPMYALSSPLAVIDGVVTSVPEPMTLALLGLGGLLLRRKR